MCGVEETLGWAGVLYFLMFQQVSSLNAHWNIKRIKYYCSTQSSCISPIPPICHILCQYKHYTPIEMILTTVEHHFHHRKLLFCHSYENFIWCFLPAKMIFSAHIFVMNSCLATASLSTYCDSATFCPDWAITNNKRSFQLHDFSPTPTLIFSHNCPILWKNMIATTICIFYL